MYRKYFYILSIGLILTLLNCFNLMAAEPFHSTTLQESSPVQVAGGAPEAFLKPPIFEVPSGLTRKVAFSGVTNKPAVHEGMDFVHSDPKKPKVPVIAAADGVVAYVRTGCPQSAVFTRNTLLREAGSGWGNHVVILHGEFKHPSTGVKYGFYTRYAHLAPGTVKLKPGAAIKKGEFVGDMGNSGRSEVRHLHFEVGVKKTGFITNKPSQSFDFVFDPARFMPKKFTMGESMKNN
jgi:murein DD-endopeptidase MepM/ murein hydrolase activator NlpD